METLMLFFKYIGTIAFAVSGASLAIKKGMDLFGVLTLGLITAVGGGLLRDLILNIYPASMFVDYIFPIIAVITSLLLFTFLFFNKSILTSNKFLKFERIMDVIDAIGLGIFTILGASIAYNLYPEIGFFQSVFAAVITGIGGGIIRDISALSMPYVFTKHIYASASFIGATVYLLIIPKMNKSLSAIIGICLIIIIRLLAAKFKWNLPTIVGRNNVYNKD